MTPEFLAWAIGWMMLPFFKYRKQHLVQRNDKSKGKEFNKFNEFHIEHVKFDVSFGHPNRNANG